MTVNYIQLYAAYIQSKRLAWSSATLASERHRLTQYWDNIGTVLGQQTPEVLWHAIQNLKPYARTTLWIRVVTFFDWMVTHGHEKTNEFKKFREENARLFKHTYTRTPAPHSIEECRARISTLNPAAKQASAEILENGLRASEWRYEDGGVVAGKGNKPRVICGPSIVTPKHKRSYGALRRALKSVGLKPHDLRKAFLTEMVRRGANQYELMALAGWSTLAPATSYIAVSENRLKELVKNGVTNK